MSLVASLAFIAFFTLRSSGDDVSGISLFCVLCGEKGSANLLLNVVLFLPFGAALGARRLSWRRAGLVGAALAVGIELAQLAIPGRSSTWRDVATNASGAAIGAGAWRTAPALIRAATVPPFSTVGALGGIVIPAAAVWITGWLLEPAVKPSIWFGLLSPRLSRLEHWSGRVDSAFVGAWSIDTGKLPENQAVQLAVAAREPIRLAGVAAIPPADWAPMLMLADDAQEEMLLVGQVGSDLIIRERRRSSALRLLEPEHRIAGFFSDLSPGDSFSMVLQPSALALCATLGTRLECSAPFGASVGWSLLYWRRHWTETTRRTLGQLSFALLWIPLGALTGRGATVRTMACAALAAGLVWVAASATGLAGPTAGEWVAALVALVIGAMMARALPVVTSNA